MGVRSPGLLACHRSPPGSEEPRVRNNVVILRGDPLPILPTVRQMRSPYTALVSCLLQFPRKESSADIGKWPYLVSPSSLIPNCGYSSLAQSILVHPSRPSLRSTDPLCTSRILYDSKTYPGSLSSCARTKLVHCLPSRIRNTSSALPVPRADTCRSCTLVIRGSPLTRTGCLRR